MAQIFKLTLQLFAPLTAGKIIRRQQASRFGQHHITPAPFQQGKLQRTFKLGNLPADHGCVNAEDICRAANAALVTDFIQITHLFILEHLPHFLVTVDQRATITSFDGYLSSRLNSDNQINGQALRERK
ncbi:hypothetical protein QE443_002009 [Pantoea ananatis]|nr:hypothetical protein [Pantoea ananatis]